MRVQVTINNVKIIKETGLNENEYNIHEFEFEFVEEYEGLTKKAVFTDANEQSYIETIVNNKCSVPTEVLHKNEYVTIGVYAYVVEDEDLKLRYSPQPTHFFVNEGSYKSVNNSTPPTPSEIEQLQSQITQNSNDIDVLEGSILNLQEEQVEQNRNIQANADDIEEIQQEQITQNTNIQKNTDDIVNINQAINTINTDITNIDSAISDINEDIDNLEQDLTNYSLITETGSQINLNINNTNYKITATLKDKNGNVIYTSNAIDLPIESMIINASYDNTTKEIVLTLQNGNTLRISIADLVSGLVSETQLQTILTNYYTKIEVDNLLSAKANQSSLNQTNQNVTNLTERVSTNETDISAIKTEQTTQNTNIEELQSQVETLQEDLESANSEIAELNTDITNMRKAMITVNGQGTDITLENTSENKLVEFELSGQTSQDTLTGKNIFSGNYSQFDNTGGTGNTYAYFKIPDETKQYTLSMIAKNDFTPNNQYIGLTGNGGNATNGFVWLVDGSNPATIAKGTVIKSTTKETLKYISMFTKNSATLQTLMNNFDIQLEEGSTATSYEPYCGGIPAPNSGYECPIKNVTGNANVKIQNKNLAWNGWAEDFVRRVNIPSGCNIIHNRFNRENVLFYAPDTGYGHYDTKYIFKTNFKENTQYTFSFDILKRISTTRTLTIEYTDGTTTPISSLSELEKWEHIILVSEPNKTIKYIHSKYTSGVTYIDLDSFMVLEGAYTSETIPSYVPHAEQNLPFTFEEGQFLADDEELQDNGIFKKWKQVTFSGTTITLEDAKSNGAYFCNKKVAGNLVGQTLTFDEEVTNAVIQYELAEPDTIQYNSTQQAQYNAIKNARSYDDQTNFSSESDELGFNMNVVAVANANKVIDSLDTRLLALESEV